MNIESRNLLWQARRTNLISTIAAADDCDFAAAATAVAIITTVDGDAPASVVDRATNHAVTDTSASCLRLRQAQSTVVSVRWW